jgi:signal transduction histidine kinase
MILPQNGFIFKFEKDSYGNFIHTYCDGGLVAKIGIPIGEIIGQTAHNFLPFEDAEIKVKHYERAWNGECVNYVGIAHGIHYLTSLNPIFKNNKVIEVIGTAIDISQEKEREQFLLKAEKLSVVGELAAGIAHEIRNPLTTLKGFTQLIKKSSNETNILPYLDVMAEEIDRINEIITEFMLLAKPSTDLKFTQVNMQYLIRSMVTLMETQAIIKNITLEAITGTEPLFVECDPNKIKQVLINLIQNAIDASPKSQSKISIYLKNINDEKYLIQVQDNGDGMSVERQAKLFEPFYTTKEKGTGLGLMVCKSIIQNHQGTIKIHSDEGKGTTVNIFLPKQITFY